MTNIILVNILPYISLDTNVKLVVINKYRGIMFNEIITVMFRVFIDFVNLFCFNSCHHDYLILYCVLPTLLRF